MGGETEPDNRGDSPGKGQEMCLYKEISPETTAKLQRHRMVQSSLLQLHHFTVQQLHSR